MDIEKAKKARPEHDLASWANPPTINCRVSDLFRVWRRSWGHNLLVLRASPESQRGNQNGHDHDRFQKFQSISPPFAASCSGLFRRGTTGKQCFSQLFWIYRKLVAGLILRSQSFPRLWS